MIHEPTGFIPYVAPIGKRPDSKFRDLTGQTFHFLSVKERAANNAKGNSFWRCECTCGKSHVVRTDHLKSGKIKSCGCKMGELVSTTPRKPGNTRSIWNGIKERMLYPSTPSYEHYKERGIKMCHGWFASYDAFLRDMGERPAGKSVDRIDNNGHYSCGRCEECKYEGWQFNCRWATPKEQSNNRSNALNQRISFRGEHLFLSEWTTKLGLNYSTALARIKSGWSAEKTFTTPVRHYQR